MVILDLNELLQAISHDTPCGEDLEYDAAFLELERSARVALNESVVGNAVVGEGPDWRVVGQQARALLSRTKDLRIVMLSIKAALRLGGLAAFADGVTALRALLECYWDAVHPCPSPGDDENLVLRVNILRELADRPAVLVPLRAAPMVRVPELGAVSLRDIQVATGELPAPTAQPAPTPVDITSIDAIFTHCAIEQLQETSSCLHRLAQDVAAIETFVTERVAVGSGLSLEALADLVARMLSELTIRAGKRLQAAPAEAASTPVAAAADSQRAPSRGQAVAVSGSIASRADVVQMLDRVCEYYDRHEPSSPVPILLRRAQRLVSMSFIELVRELTPTGLAELETIRGPQDTGTQAQKS